MEYRDFWPDFKAEKRRALNYNFPSLLIPEKIDEKKTVRVRFNDLDINQHANHRAIIELILEGIPEKILKKYEIGMLEISFKEQAFYNEEVNVESEIQNVKKEPEIIAIQQIVTEKKKKLVAKAKTRWRLQEK